MKGCRPLTDREVRKILKSFTGRYKHRDRALVLLGVKAGFRIGELLSLRLGDVLQHGRIVSRVHVRRSAMKNGSEGRIVLLHPDARKALERWVHELQGYGRDTGDTFVFQSAKGDNRPITRIHAYRLLKTAFAANQMQGVLGTHSLRKTFANNIYEVLEQDLIKTQKALGHRSIFSTVQYLSFREEEIDEAILSI